MQLTLQQASEQAAAAAAEKRFADAERLYRHLLAQMPRHPGVYNNLGIVLQEQGRLDEAISAFHRALDLQPDSPDVLNNLGMVLHAAGQAEPSIAAFRSALRAQPRHAQAAYNLGMALRERERPNEALAALYQADAARPNQAETLRAIGEILRETGNLQGAITCLQQALAIKPDDAAALNTLGVALYRSGRVDDARHVLERAVAIDPRLADAHTNLANVLRELGEADAAIACYRRAVAINNDPIADSNLIYSLYFHPAYDGPAILREHLRWNRQHAEPLAGDIRPHDNDRNPDRRLRIGYVSPDFREHVLALHFVPLFAHHDHRDLEVVCYSSVARPDATTERLRGYADVWRPVAAMPDEQLANLIRADRIDILVDLTMHMGGGRPLLFARKPAPIQIACDAYPGTTGLAAMDYRLTDPFIDPPGEHDDWYAEESLRLPDSFWVYDPLAIGPAVNPLPAGSTGRITFGALHTYTKLNDPILGLYAKVLHRVPDSRLLMLLPPGSLRDAVLKKMAKEGIAPDRLEFSGRQPREKYLELYQRIDIHLDTLPYNAHATALDSFWMGVPVVTRVGQTLVGRAGWCYLNNLKLPELAAHTDEQFVRIAAGLANDLPRLAELRATLRGRMESSPLMDGKKFAAATSVLFRQVWRRWCGA